MKSLTMRRFQSVNPSISLIISTAGFCLATLGFGVLGFGGGEGEASAGSILTVSRAGRLDTWGGGSLSLDSRLLALSMQCGCLSWKRDSSCLENSLDAESS